jgi:hypothetical protein
MSKNKLVNNVIIALAIVAAVAGFFLTVALISK